MSFEPEALFVIAFYIACLYVILWVSPRLPGERHVPGPWYRSASFWGCFVALAQIVVYALWS